VVFGTKEEVRNNYVTGIVREEKRTELDLS
jgi:hypothetical protein